MLLLPVQVLTECRQILAEDGGTPRRSGSVIVDVVVTDVNDNSPRFHSSVYNVEITEHSTPQRNVVAVRCALSASVSISRSWIFTVA